MTILLTCSAGGHLTEMRQLELFYGGQKHFFITFKRPDTESLARKEQVFFMERPARNPFSTFKAFFQAWKIISREKPELAVSTGADVTVPVCIAAKLQGIPVVFIESYCRPFVPGWSGKIVSLFADRIIYQWPNLKKYYPSGVFAGSIFAGERA